jgi:hypothetical protein
LGVPKRPPKKQKQHKEKVLLLIRTISPKGMCLMLWLGVYFSAETLGYTSRPLANLWGPFRVDLGVPNWPRKKQSSINKNSFPVVSDHFSQKNGPNDLFRSLFSSLDIEPYILSICKPLGTFLGQFGGAQMARKKQKQHKKQFSGCYGPFLPKAWA